jgi:hypothetical protein
VQAAQVALHWHQLQKKKDTNDEATLQGMCGQARLHAARQMCRSKETGAWLTAMPNTLNGTELSEDDNNNNALIKH